MMGIMMVHEVGKIVIYNKPFEMHEDL